MPALIHRPEKLQAAALKAEKAIQKLKESDADSEVVEILFAHYEDLKKRHQRLKDFEKDQLETSQVDELGPSMTESLENNDDDEETSTSTQTLYIDQLEDGTFKFTLPCTEPDGKPEVYILNSEDYDKENPILNVLITANELIRIAAETMPDQVEFLPESQLEFLSNSLESLFAQKEKIESLLENEGSPMAIEIAANLYLNDAFRYFQTSQLVLRTLGVGFDLNGSDLDEKSYQSRFYLIKQVDL